MAQPSTDRPAASLWRRAAAAMLDVALLAIPFALLSTVHPALPPLAVVLYGALFEGSARRATPGKHWCGIVVVPAEGGRLTLAHAFVRNAVKYAAPLLAGLTYGASIAIVAAPFAFADHRRGLHDHAGRSRVARVPGHGLSDITVGLLATVVPVLFVAGIVPIVMNPVYEAAARREIAAVIDSTHPQRARIAEFHARTGRLPDTLAEAGIEPPPATLAAMSYGGGIMRLELPRKDAKAAPARLVFTARVREESVAWSCAAEGIRRERLPASCRGD